MRENTKIHKVKFVTVGNICICRFLNIQGPAYTCFCIFKNLNMVKLVYSNFAIFKYYYIVKLEYSNSGIFKYFYIQILLYSNIYIFKYHDIYIFKYAIKVVHLLPKIQPSEQQKFLIALGRTKSTLIAIMPAPVHMPMIGV